jgi:hypothetical protein
VPSLPLAAGITHAKFMAERIELTEQFGLIRLYPFDVLDHVRVWSVVDIDVSRHHRDHRSESWTFDTLDVTGRITEPFERRNILDSAVLRSGGDDPLRFQNSRRASIAIVRPAGRLGAAIDPRDVSEDCARDGGTAWITTKDRVQHKALLRWRSEQGVNHESHLVGQEVYEGLRKNPSAPYSVFDNLRISDPDYQHWLLMGNMRDRPNVWVVVHLHRQKKIAQLPIVTSSWTADGRPEGWPYSEQRDRNVRSVDGRQAELMFTT